MKSLQENLPAFLVRVDSEAKGLPEHDEGFNELPIRDINDILQLYSSEILPSCHDAHFGSNRHNVDLKLGGHRIGSELLSILIDWCHVCSRMARAGRRRPQQRQLRWLLVCKI
jgi:hypothetical protein